MLTFWQKIEILNLGRRCLPLYAAISWAYDKAEEILPNPCLKPPWKQLKLDLPQVDNYSKTCVKRPLSKTLKIGFQDQLSLNAGRKYCRMLQRELLTSIKLPFDITIFVLSIFEWPFYTGFTVTQKSSRSPRGLSLTGVTALWSLSKTYLS